MTSPGPAPTVTPTPAFGDPGTHHLVCGTNPLLILWFNRREKIPLNLGQGCGARSGLRSRNPEEGGLPTFMACFK